MPHARSPWRRIGGPLLLFWLLVSAGCAADRPAPRPAVPPQPTLAATAAAVAPSPAPTSEPSPTPVEPIEPPEPPPAVSTTATLAASPTGSAAVVVLPSRTPEAGSTAAATLPPAVFKENVGVQIHLHDEDLSQIMGHLRALGAGWVKVQISWKVFEPQPDRYDEFLFGEVDALVEACQAAGIQLLLGVAKAPEWSRPTTEMDGPPQDPAQFADFMGMLAGRYRGRVAAYELWNETNLQREWNGAPLTAASFVEQVAAGAAAVRAADPAAIVISGAPAPTGINDGVTAVDDRVYFAQALAAGLAAHVDGFGVHPYGWGNPPDSTAADPPPLPSHNDHPSFFFLDTLNDYERLLRESGVDPAVQPLWGTEFGWGTTDNFGAPPVAGAEFMSYVTEADQAVYTLRALEIAGERPEVGPMIIWNLNIAATFGTEFSESAYSLLRPDGSPRPAYFALLALR